ncbi:TPA: winged helix-turn-helix transcriptional regulator [Candidatus Bathyarchaeota archaeon]|nr:winged helix-turn-helix transcriptional regulator [Candidatus Bathyarchaeota archaeon]
MQAVRVIRDPDTIRLLADLARRQLLRYISKHPMTQTELAGATRLTEPSVSHHLQILLKAGLIKIQRMEPGARGAVKKYYEPTALLFIEDWDSTPPDQRRYFIHTHLERLRGMLSVFHLTYRGFTFNTGELEELAKDIASRVSVVAERHEGDEYAGDREQLMIGIYSETLETIMGEERWRSFFEPLIASNPQTRAPLKA